VVVVMGEYLAHAHARREEGERETHTKQTSI